MSIECSRCGETLKPEMEQCPKCGSRDRRITIKDFVRLLAEEVSLKDLTPGTINAYTTALGTLSDHQSYYQQVSQLVGIAKLRGTLDPAHATEIQQVLDKWYGYSENWAQRIKKSVVEDDSENLYDVNLDMRARALEMEKALPTLTLVKEIHAEIVGYKPVWNQIKDLFNVQSVDEGETTVFSKISHEKLLNDFMNWLEKKNRERKIFANIIHGLREAGIDIIAETLAKPAIKIGVQIKDNKDIKKKDFSKKLKAQITESKKHDVKGLIIIFCGDLTDRKKPRPRERVRGMMSELSQINNRIMAISPEKALTILKEVGFAV